LIEQVDSRGSAQWQFMLLVLRAITGWLAAGSACKARILDIVFLSFLWNVITADRERAAVKSVQLGSPAGS
jgi:hypothetical protein